MKNSLFKRLGSLFVAISIICTMSIGAFAADTTISEDDLDAILRQRGYPQIYLDYLPTAAKESLYNNPNVVFDSASIYLYDNDGSYIEYDISADGAIPYGQIPDKDLALSLAISRDSVTSNLLISFTYDWKRFPDSRYDDPMGVSWDSAYFEMMDNSFYKIDKCTVTNPASGKKEYRTWSEERSYASGNASGVTWYADLADFPYGFTLHTLEGYGQFTLICKKPSLADYSSTLYGHYVHAKSSATISLGIPVFGASFTVSGNSSYDEMGTQCTYNNLRYPSTH